MSECQKKNIEKPSDSLENCYSKNEKKVWLLEKKI